MTVLRISSKPFKEAELPKDKIELINAGLQMTRDVVTKWKKGKCYDFKNKNFQKDNKDIKVQCYSTTVDADYWLSRVSKHKIEKKVYEKILYYLVGVERNDKGEWVMEDRAKRSELELEYIEVLNKVEVMQRTESGWVLVNLEYELGKPLTTREFNEWVYPIEPFMNEETGIETSLIISLVADKPLKESTIHLNHTKAYYIGVEKLEYNYKTEDFTWTMCTSSDAGGNIPKFLQNATIAKTVSKDVPYMFDHLKKSIGK
ncbi:hypothetical protein TPHA_0A02420 [Tetrapisispora phaffii CBS 4417]|uniref:DUF3074 domain-containing protein n=1 Tax=Tetrapisispora phaffii (strain ATCC 24235 / CBS 4417 / NBRC 1672 / NRRL Y-8282 / UCD 70-5) TaxID=1071381 RepID=G8BN47_TETPH|nr:hypothetical protein TPHA_0A02420 [Tetrapisispora phaffii CBS 4417]CCE61325.1 hypothetical protein TPHA_0A02420 [Tetrapisispora phaffii CBS 4417]